MPPHVYSLCLQIVVAKEHKNESWAQIPNDYEIGTDGVFTCSDHTNILTSGPHYPTFIYLLSSHDEQYNDSIVAPQFTELSQPATLKLS
jgi:hypothetical protein